MDIEVYQNNNRKRIKRHLLIDILSFSFSLPQETKIAKSTSIRVKNRIRSRNKKKTFLRLPVKKAANNYFLEIVSYSKMFGVKKRTQGACLGSGQTSLMKLFCKNSERG